MADFLLPRLTKLTDALIQVVAPGETKLSLKEPGTYTVFHEERSVVDGRLYQSQTISGLRVTVQSAATGQEIPVLPAAFNETYSLGSRSGTSAFTFEIAEPGSYRLVAAYDDGRSEPRVALAIGHNFLSSLMLTILGSLAIVFGAIALAIIIVIVVWQRRSAAARA